MKQTPTSASELSLFRPEINSVQSVWRALDLLEAFPTYGPVLGLTSIAGYSNMNKATAHRLLATLKRVAMLSAPPTGASIAWACAPSS